MDEKGKERVYNAGNVIAEHLGAIARLYTDEVFITLVVRNPGYPDGSRDTMLTNDPDGEAAARVIEQINSRPGETFVITNDSIRAARLKRILG
jgi:hypothetical protein